MKERTDGNFLKLTIRDIYFDDTYSSLLKIKGKFVSSFHGRRSGGGQGACPPMFGGRGTQYQMPPSRIG